jgi:penicillin-binding protein 1A
MLTPEKKIERKLKEMILAIKLNNYIRKDIKQKYNNLSSDQIDRRVKEKILELYSNYIFLGNNAYGIETAAQTYFATGASNLTILQAAILAGIPQAPSKYDPYTNKDLLM